MSKYIDMFENPFNGYVATVTTPFSFLLCIIFGPLYFLMKGNFKHFLLSAILACCTYGISWVIYPFSVYEINQGHYLKR
ncbi:hypothetical protein MUK70_06455 [Dyadobacter chenwenxiniae]|uniref:Uncharacterized protein n=1 Tax=Dyadobacter chenwenxiniae TaxID=2906456 RepID=A0A9X1PPN3_9BACT|nr:hypothetical protein [Dyadobacter chenwenxiniae]MCF0065100.1 hypothetical protein [Dyadobacter chenwenxiniae]UON84628.1 hypothetical protein MUK70_06455 [Dyadobacter chenwenxiniae]